MNVKSADSKETVKAQPQSTGHSNLFKPSPLFPDDISLPAMQLGVIATTCLTTFLIAAINDTQVMISEYQLSGLKSIRLVAIAGLASVVIFFVSIPTLITDIIISRNKSTIDILRLTGATQDFIMRQIMRLIARNLWAALKKAIAVDFMVYSAINYILSLYYNVEAASILKISGRVLLSGMTILFAIIIAIRIQMGKAEDLFDDSYMLRPSEKKKEKRIWSQVFDFLIR